jgi:pimeloyl-ACP methyl ester carboxylesterase
MPAIEHSTVEVNGLRMHVAATGPKDGHVLLFLHGFPEYWGEWEKLMTRLGGRFRCIAPDQAGYNLTDKPKDIARYRAKRLIEDIHALAEVVSPGAKFTLVAHDWGGALAWGYALGHPDRLSGLVILNAVHPGIFQRELARNPDQAAASQYILAFRDADAVERLSRDNYADLWKSLAPAHAAGHLTDAERDGYLAAWSQPGAVEAMIAWYRAMKLAPPGQAGRAEQGSGEGVYDPESLVVKVPTLVFWGLRDNALLPGCVDGLERFVPDLKLVRFPEGTHWIAHEYPDEIARGIAEFVGKSRV